jgi:hypothetical protein
MKGWKVNNELGTIWKEVVVTSIRLKGLRKTMNNLSQGNRSQDRDLNPGYPDYRAEILTTRPRRSAIDIYNSTTRRHCYSL